MKDPVGHFLCIKEEPSIVGGTNATKIRPKSSLTFHDWRKKNKTNKKTKKPKMQIMSCSNKLQDQNQNMAKVKCTKSRVSEVGRKN